jgi:ABC-2 type transport system permease protein
MKTILKIAGAELRNLFFSPIAWLIILVFYVVCGYQFVNPLVDVARIQEANLENDPAWIGFGKSLTIGLFNESIQKVFNHFYLFIPLMTMGVINREVNSGTMKLLYSSPIRMRDIVLGKYLGLIVFSFLLLAIVALLFATGYFTILHAEYKWYLSILLAAFLLSSAYIAIGLFISSLTNYQIVAGILTFAVFFILQALRELWQDLDFFRDITYFLAMTNKAEVIIGGLITTRDVLYFVLIIMMFLAFALIKLKSKQESRSWRVAALRYVAVSMVILTLGYFSSRPGYVGYYDVTRGQINSIHPATQKALKELDGSPLTITLYTNILGRTPIPGLPQFRNRYIWDYWEKFVRYYPGIRYKYEYYYDVNEQNKYILKAFPNKSIHQVAASIAELLKADISRFKKPEEIRKLIDLKNEDYGLIMELEYKGRKELLRTYMDTEVFPHQIHVSGTIRRLTRPSTPKILFTSGHYERSPYRNGEREYGHNTNDKGSRSALINMGVDIDTISLLHKDIPADVDVLVVADPKSALDSIEKNKIIQYLNKGGNAIFYGEPGKQDMLNPILQTIGVTLDPGTIVMPRKHNLPNSFDADVTAIGTRMAEEPALVGSIRSGTLPQIYLYGVANLGFAEKDGFTIQPVYGITPTHDAWIENGPFVADSAAPVFNAAEGDVRRSYFVAGVQMTRKINNREQRIMVSGDADFMSPRRMSGAAIKNGMFSWALYNDYPVYANYPDPIDVKVKIGFDAARTLYIVYVYVIPAIVLLYAVLLLIRRKRK